MFTVSPDFTKLAIAPAYGMILELFDLEKGLECIGTRRFILPEFDVEHSNIVLTDRTITGVSSMSSSGTRLYVGMVEGEAPVLLLNKNNQRFFPYLAVFDWEGTPLFRVKTECDIRCVAYDETEDVVYAILMDSDRVNHLGRMDMSRFK